MSFDTEVPAELPVVPLRSTIVFPTSVLGLQIGAPYNLEVLSAHPERHILVALVLAPGEPDDPIDARTLNKIGVMARLSDQLNLPGGSVQVTVHGIRRVRLSKVRVEPGAGYIGSARAIRPGTIEPAVADDVIGRILTTLESITAEIERVPREIPAILRMNIGDPARFADLVATLTNFSVARKDEVVQLLDVEKRLRFVLEELETQFHRLKEVEAASERPRGEEDGDESEPERAQRLRQRIRSLQVELGEIDPTERQAIELLRRAETVDLPQHVAARVRTEIERLRAAGLESPEAEEIRSYLEYLITMPWSRFVAPPPSEIDLDAVRSAMNRCLLGLDEPKDRLLDYLAVARLRGDLQGQIICLVGPSHTGKSSLARTIAEGLGRPIEYIELGGKSEAHLVGDRRTRSAARAGRIVGVLRDANAMDAVIVLEEIDQVGLGNVDGDPVTALEEVIEWRGRSEFVDRYLDVPVDLTRALFIATSQDFMRIPVDLREHLVEIRLGGYTPEEKVQIARERLLPELIRENGLERKDLRFPREALYFLARGYARDSGVGLMRRELSALLRTRARAKAQGTAGRWTFNEERIEEILGSPRYTATVAESAPEVGVVTGLAWTAAGGELMFIEALKMPGSGRLQITGSLGEVMRESVNAAYSYTRSRAASLGIDDEAFSEYDLHVHFPEAAIPKDGPSAGIAVALAIASTLSNRPVRHDIAMTGEVTLRGKVLEVGGIKEKVLAAYRAGVRRVIVPRGNQRDLRDVPDEAKEKITFTFVERLDEVFPAALLEAEARIPDARDAWRREGQRRREVEEDIAPPAPPRAASDIERGAVPGEPPGLRPGRPPGKRPGAPPGGEAV
ncbi:MAG TPA: S16 family serine protease [Longimicrobiales bacterium]|nr:S16 family serine protease [Longimicrobiales bacterium]